MAYVSLGLSLLLCWLLQISSYHRLADFVSPALSKKLKVVLFFKNFFGTPADDLVLGMASPQMSWRYQNFIAPYEPS